MPPRKRSGDLTGNKSAELREKHADELKEKANRLTMLQAASEAEMQQPVDLSGPDTETVGEGDAQVEVKRTKKRVRAMEDVEATIGAGQNYNLEKGRTYDLPSHVADHLLEKGLVWA